MNTINYAHVDENAPKWLRLYGLRGKVGVWLMAKGFKKIGLLVGFAKIDPEALPPHTANDTAIWTVTHEPKEGTYTYKSEM